MITDDPELSKLEEEERRRNTIKQVIVVRADLKMQRGKEVAQGSHASMAFITRRMQTYKAGAGRYRADINLSDVEVEWLNNGRFTKVCLAADSREQLLALHEAAKAAGLESHLITDSGMTVFHGVPTDTAIAIGPDFAYNIDPITKGLKLR